MFYLRSDPDTFRVFIKKVNQAFFYLFVSSEFIVTTMWLLSTFLFFSL